MATVGFAIMGLVGLVIVIVAFSHFSDRRRASSAGTNKIREKPEIEMFLVPPNDATAQIMARRYTRMGDASKMTYRVTAVSRSGKLVNLAATERIGDRSELKQVMLSQLIIVADQEQAPVEDPLPDDFHDSPNEEMAKSGLQGDELNRLLTWAMVAMSAVDGELDEQETETIMSVYRNITGGELGAGEISAYANTRLGQEVSSEYTLGNFVLRMSELDKTVIVQAAYLVAAANDEISQSEADALNNIAKALDMTPAQYRQVIDRLSA